MHSRRDFLTSWLKGISEPDRAPLRPGPPRNLLPEFIRPPGALPEPEFMKSCDPCEKCAEACPYDVILPLGPAYGDKNGTPAILPRGGPCHMCEDMPCAAACPTDALTVIPWNEVKMGLARLSTSRCWAAQGQPCDYCIKECPVGEKALKWNGVHPEVVEPGCTGCGMCTYICPTTPKAITIESI